MLKHLILLLLLSVPFISFAQKGVRVINNKGTVIYVDPSKWFQVAGNLYNKNGNGNVAIGLDTTMTVGARLVVKGDGTLPPLMLQNVLAGASSDRLLTWDSTTGVVRSTAAGSFSWLTTGNTGTTAGTNFMGTTDNQDLVFKTNNTEAARFSSGGQLLVNTPASLTGGTTAKLQINNGTTAGAIQIVDGTQGLGKVLTSDANGLATWADNTTTVSNTSAGNNLTTTVNGVTGAAVNMINSNDLTVDATGKLTSTVNGVADPTPVQLVVDANNGLTPANGVVQLGGVLIKPTTITTDVTNTLAVTGLQTSVSATDQMVMVDPATGVLKTQTVSATEPWYDMATSKGATLNTQDVYIKGKAAVGTTTPATVAASGTTQAELTVTGGDASINGVTVGKGGGQISTNTVNGGGALYSNTTGMNNTATGSQALYSNTVGSQNTANGKNALYLNTTGVSNTAIGYQALNNNNGSSNTATGSGALAQNIVGNNNTANGYNALNNNKGDNNTASGYYALNINSSGSGNVATGHQTLAANQTGSNNVAVGLSALNLLKGDSNIAIGAIAGSRQTVGTGNIIIASPAGGADLPALTGSNQLNIGNTIFGTGINTATVGAGNIGIGTTTPNTKLEVQSSTANTSGLRFTNLTSASPVTAGATAIGVNATGDVVTTDISLAANAWNRNGNDITSSPANFLGTTGANDLVIKTNNTEAARFSSGGQLLVNTPASLTGGTTAKLQINNGTTAGAIQIVDGTQGLGKVLTSDANGLATWATDNNWKTNGNTGTNLSTNFLGTTDNMGINFRTNNTNRLNLSATGDLLLQSATNRIWGITGFSAGQTVHFQYGGDNYNEISTTFGGTTQFKSYYGTQFYNVTAEIARFGLAYNNQNSYFNYGLSIGSATSPSNKLHVFSGVANTSGVRLNNLTSASPDGTSTSYLAVDANGDIVRGAAVSSTTTVSNTSIGNNLTTTVNGVTGTAVNMINSNDLTVDATGKLTSTVNGVADPTPVQVVVDANNGLTPANGVVQLGGVLTKPTTITTDAINTLAVSGLQPSVSGTDNLVVSDPATGVLRSLNSSALNNNWRTIGNTGTTAAVSAGGYGTAITSGNFAGTIDNKDWVLATNNIERMRMLGSNGNVGIGTATPANKLEVNSGTNDVSGLRFTQLKSTSPAPVAYNSKVLTVNATGDVGLTTVPGTESIVDFSVNSDPNVGGTTFSPDIQKDSDIIYIATIDNSSWTWNGATYVAYTPTTTAWIQGGNSVPSMRTLGTKTNFELPIITNNVERIRVLSGTTVNTTQVGVATTNPAFTTPANTGATIPTLGVDGTVNATNYTSPVQTVTGGAWDLSKGSNAKWTLGAGANTLTLSNMKPGMYGTIIVTNTGTSTIVFGGGTNKVINGGAGVVTLTPVAGAVDILSFMYDGTTFWWTVGNNYN